MGNGYWLGLYWFVGCLKRHNLGKMMKTLIILLLISINTYAQDTQEQKYVDMTTMRQFNFIQGNGIG